jgi:uncharacterized membrane protein YhhN
VFSAAPDEAARAATMPRRWWWGFVPYALVAAVHVVALAASADAVSGPTKLMLMPLLAVAVLWAGRGSSRTTPFTFLFMAIALSWLGDGAATFFPAAPDLPVMLACFGLAHLCYIWLFWRCLAVRRIPRWALVYVLWWVAMLAILWPLLGALTVAVALYGLVLGGTAVAASRCHPLVVVGGALFLTSDTLLSVELFVPGAPDWLSPLVMLTYTVGQGFIAAGAVVGIRGMRRAAT